MISTTNKTKQSVNGFPSLRSLLWGIFHIFPVILNTSWNKQPRWPWYCMCCHCNVYPNPAKWSPLSLVFPMVSRFFVVMPLPKTCCYVGGMLIQYTIYSGPHTLWARNLHMLQWTSFSSVRVMRFWLFVGPRPYPKIDNSKSTRPSGTILVDIFVNIPTICSQKCIHTLIARFMGPTRSPSGADRTQVGPMLAPWTLQSG